MARTAIPGAQNYYTRSQEFENAAWFKQGVVASDNAIAAPEPDGTLTAASISASAVAGVHVWNYSTTLATTIGQRLSASIYVAPGELSKIQVWINNTMTNAATFDLGARSASGVAAGVTATITDAGGDWSLLDVLFTATVAGSLALAKWYLHNGASISFTGSGAIAVYAWGAMLCGGRRGPYAATTSAALNNGPLRAAASGRVAATGRTAATGRVAT